MKKRGIEEGWDDEGEGRRGRKEGRERKRGDRGMKK